MASLSKQESKKTARVFKRKKMFGTTDPPSKQNMISEYSFYVSISHRISMYPTLGAVWQAEGSFPGVVVIISL